MITPDKLASLKLVTDDALFLSEQDTLDRVDLAVQQAAGGWGVKRDDAAILKLARDLKISGAIAAEAEERHRNIKGLQLENGRLKKARDNAQAAAEAATQRVEELEEKLKEAERKHKDLNSLLLATKEGLHSD